MCAASVSCDGKVGSDWRAALDPELLGDLGRFRKCAALPVLSWCHPVYLLCFLCVMLRCTHRFLTDRYNFASVVDLLRALRNKVASR